MLVNCRGSVTLAMALGMKNSTSFSFCNSVQEKYSGAMALEQDIK
jgi:hypothetical protein